MAFSGLGWWKRMACLYIPRWFASYSAGWLLGQTLGWAQNGCYWGWRWPRVFWLWSAEFHLFTVTEPCGFSLFLILGTLVHIPNCSYLLLSIYLSQWEIQEFPWIPLCTHCDQLLLPLIYSHPHTLSIPLFIPKLLRSLTTSRLL